VLGNDQKITQGVWELADSLVQRVTVIGDSIVSQIIWGISNVFYADTASKIQ